MNNYQRFRILGNILMMVGAIAFSIELLCDQNYLHLTDVLGGSFTCGFGGLGGFVMGAGIAEWARLSNLKAQLPVKLNQHSKALSDLSQVISDIEY